MYRRTPLLANQWLTMAKAAPPVSVIRSGRRHWVEPERMVRMKLMYFTLGIDQLPLRRTAVIHKEADLFKKCPSVAQKSSAYDSTGYKMRRHKQMMMWYRRIQYQEYYLQHMFTRHTWGLLRMYPTGGAKIAGKADTGYAGYDYLPYHRYTREPLPAHAREIYDRRKLF